MKKRVLIIIGLVAILLCGCSSRYANIKVTDHTYLLGTLVKITIYGRDVSDEEFQEVFKIISDIEKKVSKNIPDNEISMINNSNSDEVKISNDTYNIIEKGLYYSTLSQGKFDITIAPLVDLWGIGSENAHVPNNEEIMEALNRINYNRINLIKKNQSIGIVEDTKIDLGGIAKGYVADKVSSYLKDNNMGHAVINLGGNILTVGKKPNGDSWKIGIQNPLDNRGKELGIVTIGEKSVVTSGIYERYLEEDGVKYHHILNPFTGYPIENDLVSVTIISDHSVDGDGLSTVAFSQGLKEGYSLVEDIDNVEAIFITKYNEVYLTTGAKDIFELRNYKFKIKELE
jgi:thiamine biosynthesis lipoprotein